MRLRSPNLEIVLQHFLKTPLFEAILGLVLSRHKLLKSLKEFHTSLFQQVHRMGLPMVSLVGKRDKLEQ